MGILRYTAGSCGNHAKFLPRILREIGNILPRSRKNIVKKRWEYRVILQDLVGIMELLAKNLDINCQFLRQYLAKILQDPARIFTRVWTILEIVG